MLANFFGKSNPANFIVIFLIFLGFFLAKSISLISTNTIDVNLVIEQVSILALFLLMFLFYNFILSKNKLTLYNSYGLLLFVLFFGFYPETMSNRNEVFLNVLLLVFLRRVYSLRSSKDVYKKIFDSGFWLGILFLLAPTTVIFGILMFLSIGLFQKINIRTLLIPCLGFLAPIFCYATYCFWFDHTEEFTTLFLWYADYDFELYTTKPILFSSLLLGAFTIISIVLKTPKVLSISGSYRKYWILIIFNLIIAITVLIIQKTHDGSQIILLFFPVSIIITNWLESIKKPFLKNIFIALLLITPVIIFIV
ncbi:DUF6427 family protein [Flavobacteriaceae bacterium]|jgi:hypothetical protein|nr:DUF6427 family protein [Flavobacteriaceae bacterium]